MKLLKHVQLIVFENIMNVKKKHLFLIKEVVARFDKKIASIDDPREESITADPEEDSITEKSKRTLSLKNLKRILSMEKLSRALLLWHL